MASTDGSVSVIEAGDLGGGAGLRSLPRTNGEAPPPGSLPSSFSQLDTFSSTEKDTFEAPPTREQLLLPMPSAGTTAQGGAGGHQEEKEGGTASMLAASFNFINSIVGAGIIGMPLALREAGFGFGIMLIIMVGWITDYSVRTLVRSGVAAGKSNYQDLVQLTLGRWGYRALTFGQLLFPFFGMIAYGIIVGQTMPKIFAAALGESFLSQRRPVIALLTFGLMIPLSMNKVRPGWTSAKPAEKTKERKQEKEKGTAEDLVEWSCSTAQRGERGTCLTDGRAPQWPERTSFFSRFVRRGGRSLVR